MVLYLCKQSKLRKRGTIMSREYHLADPNKPSELSDLDLDKVSGGAEGDGRLLEPARPHILDEPHQLPKVPLLIVIHLQVAAIGDDHA